MIRSRFLNFFIFRLKRSPFSALIVLLTVCFCWLAVNVLSDYYNYPDRPATGDKKFYFLNKLYDKVGGGREGATSEPKIDFEAEYENLTCKFARLDPWDPTILKLVHHPRTLDCPQRQPNFTYVHLNGTLNLNASQVERYLDLMSMLDEREVNVTLNCTYATFERDPTRGDDKIRRTVTTGQLTLYTPVELDTDMVETICYNDNGTEIYYDLHAHPSPPRNKTFAKPYGDQLSVLMLMLDSTSTSVLKRHLSKTYDYIKNVMRFKIFNGFSKVGDNSFPNMIAALTGYRYQYEQRDMPPDIDEDIGQINFDHWPLVWKQFGAKGYATMFNEDKSEWGLFHYLAKGFKNKPVDYFYHLYWYSVYLREWYSKTTDTYCFMNRPKVDRLLDIARRHLITMKDVLQFQYTFLTDLCHEYEGSEEERADEYVYNFLKTMFEGGYFNNTAVLFFGDHGHRFSPVRGTLVGLLEERTPMFNIWFPDWFYARYPRIERNLELNTMRLSSLFDVHRTLIDLADGNFRGVQRPMGSRGFSQLYPIPINRTCHEAGVPDHHCTCTAMEPLDVLGDEASAAALALLRRLDEVLAPYGDLCRNFTLTRVMRAERLSVNGKIAQGVKNYDVKLDAGFNASSNASESTSSSALPSRGSSSASVSGTPKTAENTASLGRVRVAVEVDPMGAQFEATVEYSADNGTWAVDGDVSRLNVFGLQSHCAPRKFLQKFCVCRELSLTGKKL